MNRIYLLAAIVLLNGCGDSEQKAGLTTPYDFRTFDRQLDLTAPGCELKSPSGESLNEVFKNIPPGKGTFQRGTTFTLECFPILPTEKSTLIDQ